LGYALEPGYGRRLVHALVVTLSHSRHQFLWPLYRYRLADLIEGLEEAWLFFGGTSLKVVLDNMKAAIHKADRYDPVFMRVFEEYAGWRGFVIDPARVRHPQDKGLISYCTACAG
jgi:transposase